MEIDHQSFSQILILCQQKPDSEDNNWLQPPVKLSARNLFRGFDAGITTKVSGQAATGINIFCCSASASDIPKSGNLQSVGESVGVTPGPRC